MIIFIGLNKLGFIPSVGPGVGSIQVTGQQHNGGRDSGYWDDGSNAHSNYTQNFENILLFVDGIYANMFHIAQIAFKIVGAFIKMTEGLLIINILSGIKQPLR